MKSYYHKYFEGYKEERVLNKNGKGTHIEYTYDGYYFRRDLHPAVRLALRAAYLLLTIAAAAAFLFAGTRMTGANAIPVMVVLQAVTTLVFLWFAWVMAFYVFAPAEMTIYKYRSTAEQLLKVCGYLTAILTVDAVVVLAAGLMTGAADAEFFRCVFSYLGSGAVIAGLGVMEYYLPYERLSNDRNIVWTRKKMKWI